MSQTNKTPAYSIESLRLTIGSQTLVDNLDLDLYPGECWCVLGKNGSGKTTLLSTMAGLLLPDNGRLFIDNTPLADLRRRQIAQKVGLLFQEYPNSFPVTVFESVMAGRYPHMQSWQSESANDQNKVREALAFVQMSAFQGRMINTLSGGEKRRSSLATLLAQEPTVYLLDEPSNHLDLHFQASLIPELCSAITNKNGIVFMSLHDINLASQLTDKCLLLMGNGEYLQGDTHQVLNQENLESLYNQRFEKIKTSTGTQWLPVIG